MSSRQIPARVRQANPADRDTILELLTGYGLPRSYFEPFYLDDPTYRPQDSWVVELDRELVAHLRIYRRSINLAGVRLPIGGLGNVITHAEARGRGYADQLLEAALSSLRREDLGFSLLWTHIPRLYSRHGYVPIHQERLRTRVSPSAAQLRIEPFKEPDLHEVMQLYEEVNASRTGPTVRSKEYWLAQRRWLHEKADDFLVGRNQDGNLAGYVRRRSDTERTDVGELGIRQGDFETGRSLLASASFETGGEIEGCLPRSLHPLFGSESAEEEGLMGHPLNLTVLRDAIVSLWEQRAPETEGLIRVALPQGLMEIANKQDAQRLGGQPDSLAGTLDGIQFSHLLFHGFDDRAHQLLGDWHDRQLLTAVFPPQDFVIWETDAF